jgi:uracil-DNA glycosylase
MTIQSLSDFVKDIRKERKLDREVPDFDPRNGNEQAKYLLVLEAPGPKALDSGCVSFDNPDRTASNLKSQLHEAKVKREEIAIWNIVPWYIGNEGCNQIRAANRDDFIDGLPYLLKIVERLPNLRCVVLIGGVARRAHVALSITTTARILSCHHTSPRVMRPGCSEEGENIEVFRKMQQ